MRYVIYFIIFSGLVTMNYESINYMKLCLMGKRAKFRIRRNIIDKRYVGTSALEGIRKSLEASNLNRFISIKGFCFIILMMFLVGFISSYMSNSIATSLVYGLYTSLIPYIILRLKVSRNRYSASLEGDILIRELYSSYKINNKKMLKSIEYCAENLEKNHISRSILMNLAAKLETSFSEKELEHHLEIFRYSIDTSWAASLKSCISDALAGDDIENSLEDLSKHMMKLRFKAEYGKRSNNESRLIIKYMIPITYILTIFCSIKYFSFTFKKFIFYQFGTEIGLRWFYISLGLYLLSIYIFYKTANDKLDV